MDTFTRTEWVDKLALYEVTLGQMACCHQTPKEISKIFRQGNENLKKIKWDAEFIAKIMAETSFVFETEFF